MIAIAEANKLWDEVMEQELEKWKKTFPEWAGMLSAAGLTEKDIAVKK